MFLSLLSSLSIWDTWQDLSFLPAALVLCMMVILWASLSSYIWELTSSEEMHASSNFSVQLTLQQRSPTCLWVWLAHRAQYHSGSALLPTLGSLTISPPMLLGHLCVPRPTGPFPRTYLYLLPLVFSTLLTPWNVPVPALVKSYSFLRYAQRFLPLALCGKSLPSAL